MVNIDVMNHGDEVESMQPNIEEPDTESGLLAKTHPIVIGIKEEDEEGHSGKKETDRESDFAGDTDANIGDMIIGEIVEGGQPDIKGSDTKANLLEEAHSIVIDIIDEVEDKHSGTEEPNQKSELEITTSSGNESKPLSATVSINLTRNVEWSKGTAVLPTIENSTIEIRPDDIPKSKREEEVDQSGEKETVEEHLYDDAT